MPIMKAMRPNQADARCTFGRPKTEPSLSPSLSWNAMNVKRKKKTTEKPREIATKAGVAVVGDDRISGDPLGRAARLKIGDRDAAVQFNVVASLGREHEPRAPMKTLGPSTLEDWVPFRVKAVDGVTDKSETCPARAIVGERKTSKERMTDVRSSTGAR